MPDETKIERVPQPLDFRHHTTASEAALRDTQTQAAPPRVDFTRAHVLTPEVAAAIDDAFGYHKWNELQVAWCGAVRAALAEAVKVIVANVPPSPDRTTAIRKIREARMDANSAITHGGKY